MEALDWKEVSWVLISLIWDLEDVIWRSTSAISGDWGWYCWCWSRDVSVDEDEDAVERTGGASEGAGDAGLCCCW
jgi:hypothetical protein